jgi:hypothetical protein
MPKPSRYARIAITLPRADLAAADRLARAHDRSRSWIVAEAIRRFAQDSSSGSRRADVRPAAPPGAELVATGLGPSRLNQLKRDLALTPEERVRAAEETLRTVPVAASSAHRLLAFDRYEDFLEWQRRAERPR